VRRAATAARIAACGGLLLALGGCSAIVASILGEEGDDDGLGAACVSGEDCGFDDPSCVISSAGFPGGYCSRACDAAVDACGAIDGVCGMTEKVWKLAGPTCVLPCETHDDCRDDNYLCKKLCDPANPDACETGTFCLPSAVGAPCKGDGDCSWEGGEGLIPLCVRQFNGVGGSPMQAKGGYCAATGCNPAVPEGACGPGARCIDFVMGGTVTCMHTCAGDNDCRVGYSCRAVGRNSDNVCLPTGLVD